MFFRLKLPVVHSQLSPQIQLLFLGLTKFGERKVTTCHPRLLDKLKRREIAPTFRKMLSSMLQAGPNVCCYSFSAVAQCQDFRFGESFDQSLPVTAELNVVR